MWRYGIDRTGSEWGQVAGTCVINWLRMGTGGGHLYNELAQDGDWWRALV
jgi:hypothetical protein